MATAAATLWIGDLEPHMSEDFIMQSFNMMGESPVSCKIIRDRMTGLTRGYGFVGFDDEMSASRARMNCNGKVLPNDAQQTKQFRLNPANSNGQRTGGGYQGYRNGQPGDLSLFVGDLTPEVDDTTLFNAFASRYPSVKSAKVIMDPSGTSRGFGFIRFENDSEFQSAMSDMQNALGVGQKPIRVGNAQPRRSNFDQSPRGGGNNNASAYYNAANMQQYNAAAAAMQQGYGMQQAYPQYGAY